MKKSLCIDFTPTPLLQLSLNINDSVSAHSSLERVPEFFKGYHGEDLPHFLTSYPNPARLVSPQPLQGRPRRRPHRRN